MRITNSKVRLSTYTHGDGASFSDQNEQALHALSVLVDAFNGRQSVESRFERPTNGLGSGRWGVSRVTNYRDCGGFVLLSPKVAR